MADDFDPLMNPEPEAAVPPPKHAAAARTSVALNAPAPTFAPPPRPSASSMFDNLDDSDDPPAPAPSPAKPPPASNSAPHPADDQPRAAAHKAPAIAPSKSVEAGSSNASPFTGVSRRGCSLFQGCGADVLPGAAADVFIPSEARGLETGIEAAISVEALDDSLLRVSDDDLDTLFAEQQPAAAPSRRDRLGLYVAAASSAPAPAHTGPKAKIAAAASAAPLDDDDDLFGDIGAKSDAHGALGAMSGLNLQDYIAKQKSR